MTAKPPASPLSPLDRQLVNAHQQDFPLVPEPYAAMGERFGLNGEAVLERLRELEASGVISRVGVVLRPGSVGASTLAAMAVPSEEIDRVAGVVSGFREVNHNYEREHALNLWFVITAASPERLQEVLAEITRQTGIAVHSMPLVEDYFINLGFPLN